MEVKSASCAKLHAHCRKINGNAFDCTYNERIKLGLFNRTIMFLTCITLFSGFCISTSVCGAVNVNASGNSIGDDDGVIRSVSENATVLPTSATSPVSNDLLNHLKSPTKSSVPSSSEESADDDYYYSEEDFYADGNSTGKNKHHHHHGSRHDNTKLAQVIVYFSVIFIALAGVLIKYFVTEYETSQMKAHEQLSYKRLDHPQS